MSFDQWFGLVFGLALMFAALWMFGAFGDNRIIRGLRFVIELSQGLALFAQPYLVIYIAIKLSQ